jgi:hypothetical protein
VLARHRSQRTAAGFGQCTSIHTVGIGHDVGVEHVQVLVGAAHVVLQVLPLCVPREVAYVHPRARHATGSAAPESRASLQGAAQIQTSVAANARETNMHRISCNRAAVPAQTILTEASA